MLASLFKLHFSLSFAYYGFIPETTSQSEKLESQATATRFKEGNLSMKLIWSTYH